jgi:hypothetical protein
VTTSATRLRASQASDRLTVALLTIASQGVRTNCSDPETHHYWTSEHAAERKLASFVQGDCLLGSAYWCKVSDLRRYGNTTRAPGDSLRGSMSRDVTG